MAVGDVERLIMARQKLKKTRPRVIIGEVKEQVEARLLLKYSLDQISKKLASQGIMISVEFIYQHLLNDRKRGGGGETHEGDLFKFNLC